MNSFLLLLLHFSISYCLLIEINDTRTKYCFNKKLTEPDKIKVNYLITSDKAEKLKVVFDSKELKKVLFHEEGKQSGEYKSESPLPKGTYTLCFYPQEKKVYHVSFELSSFLESGRIEEIAKDKDVKLMISDAIEIKQTFQVIEKNIKNSLDRTYRHNKTLDDIITSIKNLTLLKLSIIGILSVFQIIVIQRFFGPDKRVSTVKGAFSDGL